MRRRLRGASAWPPAKRARRRLGRTACCLPSRVSTFVWTHRNWCVRNGAPPAVQALLLGTTRLTQVTRLDLSTAPFLDCAGGEGEADYRQRVQERWPYYSGCALRCPQHWLTDGHQQAASWPHRLTRFMRLFLRRRLHRQSTVCARHESRRQPQHARLQVRAAVPLSCGRDETGTAKCTQPPPNAGLRTHADGWLRQPQWRACPCSISRAP